jgi:hypothetical protein
VNLPQILLKHHCGIHSYYTIMANPPATDAIVALPAAADVELAVLPTKITTKSDDPFLVAFEPSFDVDNPKDWPSGRKWAVTDVLSATGFNRIMVSTIMAPALTTIAHELHMSSTESMMALSIYLLATAFGPLVIGPLSEVYGRSKVLHASNVWFLVWNIVCGFAKTKEVLIAARFMAGFGASSIYALAGGVLTDVWRPEQRGRSLSIYLLIPLLGAAVGMFYEPRDMTYWVLTIPRTNCRRFHGLPNHLEMDVLVYFHLPSSHDPCVLQRLQRDLRPDHPMPSRC